MVSACNYDLVMIGASAGGINALRHILGGLARDFPIPIVIVQHLGPSMTSLSQLPDILARETNLIVKWAQQGERLVAGSVYVAPQDNHLLIDSCGCFNLDAGKKRNFVRPCVDTLFESAADRYGVRAIAIVVTGSGRDGAQGGRAIANAGGKLIAENPATALYSEMPAALIAAANVDEILPLDEIAPLLSRWVVLN